MQAHGQIGAVALLETRAVGVDGLVPVLAGGLDFALQDVAHGFLGALLLHAAGDGQGFLGLVGRHGQAGQALLGFDLARVELQRLAQLVGGRCLVAGHEVGGGHAQVGLGRLGL